MLPVFGYIGLILISTAVVWKGSEFLEGSSEKLAAYYGLPAIVQGAIIAAVGSSFPELSTTVLSSLLHGEFELGVAAIVGSAIFNIMVIPGLAGVYAEGKLQSNRSIVYKEAQFYMLSVAVLLITFSFAVIYYPVPGIDLHGTVNRWLALIPLAVYGLYIFIQYHDTMEYDEPELEEDISLGKQWGLLLLSLALILIGVEGLVHSAISLGDIFNTPSFIWGITIVAAATSIPDSFVSVRAATEGDATVSLANVFGSNIFDLLVAIPAGILIAGSAEINFALASPMMFVLIVATVILFTFLRVNLNLTTRESWVLLFLYAAFVVWMILETIGVTNLVLS